MFYEARTSTGTPVHRGYERDVRASAKADAFLHNIYLIVWRVDDSGVEKHVATYEPREQGQGTAAARRSALRH